MPFSSPLRTLAKPEKMAKLARYISTTTRPTRPPIEQHQAPLVYRFFATGLGASMWFFLMYRAKKDGAVLLGWKHPWDH